MVIRICLLFIAILSGCTVFKKNPTKGNPPGTLKINDTLYIDQFEVNNVGWREYWYYLNRSDSANAYKALPDTLVWRDSIFSNEPMVEYYFRHPMFNSYPAVGISFEQAIEFCSWRTYVANQVVYFRENKIENRREHLNDTFPIKFYYRLPTKEEWEMVASTSIDSSNKVFKKYHKRISSFFNTKEVFDSLEKTDYDPIYGLSLPTASVNSFFANKFGAYNMVGNLAEMVSEKGIAKGGSFIHPLDSCKISLDQHYDKPEVWLGFRCVAVKLK